MKIFKHLHNIPPRLLAKVFSQVIREWLTPRQLHKVIIRNQRDVNLGVCHSHDFCDANMAMLAAVNRLTGHPDNYEPDGVVKDEMESYLDPQFQAIWNKAWHLAKTNYFLL